MGLEADLGARAPLGTIADLLADWAVAVDVGHRWGAQLALAAANWDITEESYRRGPDWLEQELRGINIRPGRRLKRHRWEPWEWVLTPDPELASLRDIRAEPLLGRPATVVTLGYRNPLELILAGSGMMMAGVILAARLVRDWGAQRRTNAAIAREAEAEADMTETRAELYKWLVAEAKRGQSPLPISDLTQIVTPPEIKALNRLSETPVRLLQLPGGADASEPE